MPDETPDLLAEIEQIARQLAMTEDEDVRDSADQFIRDYKHQVRMVNGLFEVDMMVQAASEGDLELRRTEAIRRAREQLRDRLWNLLAWGRGTGKL